MAAVRIRYFQELRRCELQRIRQVVGLLSIGIVVLFFGGSHASGQSPDTAIPKDSRPELPEANPGRPTVSNPATLAPVGYLQFETGTLRATGSAEHHVAISVEPSRWAHLKANLEAAGVPTQEMSGSSLYFPGPDGERLELISDPLREMYGTIVA